MKSQPELVARVRAELAEHEGVVEKPMFGSNGFMLRGNLLAGARAERVMFRIPPAMHEWALGQPGASTVVMRGKPYVGYVHVAAEALATKAQLKQWLGLAIRHNATLPTK